MGERAQAAGDMRIIAGKVSARRQLRANSGRGYTSMLGTGRAHAAGDMLLIVNKVRGSSAA